MAWKQARPGCAELYRGLPRRRAGRGHDGTATRAPAWSPGAHRPTQNRATWPRRHLHPLPLQLPRSGGTQTMHSNNTLVRRTHPGPQPLQPRAPPPSRRRPHTLCRKVSAHWTLDHLDTRQQCTKTPRSPCRFPSTPRSCQAAADTSLPTVSCTKTHPTRRRYISVPGR